ncbi:transient receptor potential channel pyrexia-like isoform X1 [Amphibalanus amphitrite]|uniref:transient receptor potential channel pyrexia-like isoform X1 n=1 Tax=Amphibalanus amphitrite TaxID=1232801 RepID=UPI001C90DB8D|nr:transient receptor potential channel pyrexia-like isoform X1 [Amphibalanus amphitrite]
MLTSTEDHGLGRRGSDPLQPHAVQVYVTDESENGDGRRGPHKPPGKRSPWWTVLSLGSVSVMARSLRHQPSGWLEMSRRKHNMSHRYSPLNPPQPTEADQQLFEAIDRRSLEAVTACLDRGANVNAVNGFFGESALHQAARIRWRHGVELLLSRGADASIENKFFQTPLHFTAVAGCAECMGVLLARQKAAVFVQDMRGYSPLHDAALGSEVRCVRLLLEAGAEVNLPDNQGETPLHKCAKAGSIPNVVALLNGGADLKAKNSEGETALAMMLRNIPNALDQILDHCLVPNKLPKNNKNFEITINFKPLIRADALCHTDLLRNFIKIGESEVLIHPVCQSFLALKWHRVVKLFLLKLLFYLVFVIVSTFFILNKFVWDRTNRVIYPAVNASATNTSGESGELGDGESVTAFATRIMEWELGFYWTSVSMVVILVIHELLNIISSASNYFTNGVSCLNWILFCMFFAVSADSDGAWQTHLAAFYVLFLWSKTMHMIGQFPSCGIYVSMFIRVAKVFCRIFFVYFSLLVAFSISFHLAFRKAGAFKDPFNSFMKTLTLMIGEVDYEGLFLDPAAIPLRGTSHVIFFFFLVLVSIILSNLLVALAVNDVQGLRAGAHLERLKKQSQLIYNTELMTAFMKSLFHCGWLHSMTRPILDSIHLDVLSKRVFLMPNHPQKSHELQILDYKTKAIREHKINKEMLERIWRALHAQEGHEGGSSSGGATANGRSQQQPPVAAGQNRRHTSLRVPSEPEGGLRMHRGREVASARAVSFEDIKDLLSNMEARLTAQLQRQLDELRAEVTARTRTESSNERDTSETASS